MGKVPAAVNCACLLMQWLNAGWKCLKQDPCYKIKTASGILTLLYHTYIRNKFMHIFTDLRYSTLQWRIAERLGPSKGCILSPCS